MGEINLGVFERYPNLFARRVVDRLISNVQQLPLIAFTAQGIEVFDFEFRG